MKRMPLASKMTWDSTQQLAIAFHWQAYLENIITHRQAHHANLLLVPQDANIQDTGKVVNTCT